MILHRDRSTYAPRFFPGDCGCNCTTETPAYYYNSKVTVRCCVEPVPSTLFFSITATNNSFCNAHVGKTFRLVAEPNSTCDSGRAGYLWVGADDPVTLTVVAFCRGDTPTFNVGIFCGPRSRISNICLLNPGFLAPGRTCSPFLHSYTGIPLSFTLPEGYTPCCPGGSGFITFAGTLTE